MCLRIIKLLGLFLVFVSCGQNSDLQIANITSTANAIYGELSFKRIVNQEDLEYKNTFQHGRILAYFDKADPDKKYVCSATPISDNHVITAAHCLMNKGRLPYQTVYQPMANYAYKPQNMFAKNIYISKEYLKLKRREGEDITIQQAEHDLAVIEFDRTHYEKNAKIPYGYRSIYFIDNRFLTKSDDSLNIFNGFVVSYPNKPKQGFYERIMNREDDCKIQAYNDLLYVSTCDSIGGVSGAAFMGKLPDGTYQEYDVVFAINHGSKYLAKQPNHFWHSRSNQIPGNLTNLKDTEDIHYAHNVFTRINIERYVAISSVLQGRSQNLFEKVSMSTDTFASIDFLNRCDDPMQITMEYKDKFGNLTTTFFKLDGNGEDKNIIENAQRKIDKFELISKTYKMNQMNLRTKKVLYFDTEFDYKGHKFTAKTFNTPNEDTTITLECF